MAYLEFQKVQLSNFKSYGKTPTEFILDKGDITLLIGKSGSGKTSIPSAIYFCLFGDTLEDVNLSQLVNRTNEENCWVQTKFKAGSKQCVVRRGISPSSLDIEINGKPVNKDSHSRDLQKYLEAEILKIDRKTFRQLVLVSNINFENFLHLPAAERRTIVDKALWIEILSQMASLLKIKDKDLETRLYEIQRTKEPLEEKAQIHREYIEKKENEGKRRLKELKNEIRLLTENNESLNIELVKIRDTDLAPLIQDLPKRGETQDKLNKTIRKIAKLEFNISQNNKKIALVQKGFCPVCKTKFSDSESKAELKRLNKENEQMLAMLDMGKNIKIKLTKRLQSVEARHEEIRILKTRMENKTFAIRQNRSNITKLERQAERLREAKDEDLSGIQKEIESIEQDIKQNRIEQKKLDNLKPIYKTALQLLKDDGIKAAIIKRYIPKINLFINKFLSAMDMNISFHLDENFDEHVKTSSKIKPVFNSFSDGQRQRINLAILLTWREIAKARSSVSTNLLFIDEVADSSLDLEEAEIVVDMLKSDLFKGNNIFMISHKPELESKVSKTVNFELKGGFTKVI